MSVYIDNAFNPYKSKRNRGRVYKMSHMVADTMDELQEMARKLGLKHEWLQHGSFPHYDVTKTKRKEAIELGAIELSEKQLIKKIQQLRKTEEFNFQSTE